MSATIDNALEQAYRENPEQTASVIVIISAPTDAAVDDLTELGLEITNREHAEHGMVYGRLHLRRLPELRQLSHVDSISLDTPQHAF